MKHDKTALAAVAKQCKTILENAGYKTFVLYIDLGDQIHTEANTNILFLTDCAKLSFKHALKGYRDDET